VIGGGAVGNGSNTVTLGNDSIVKTILKGSVGIGTDSPDTVLNLEGLKNTSIITLGSTNNDGGWSVGDKIGAINFYSYDGSSSAGAGLKGSISYENEQGNTGEYLSLVFRTAGRNTGTNNTERMRIDSDGNTAFSGSISTTGTISGVLANGVTATTQTAGDNSTKVATTAYANAAGITTAQANEIAANTLKVGYTDALVSANVSVVANTAKVGITTQQAADIVVNNAKVGITTAQANAIVTNTTNIATNTNEIATNTIAPQSAGQSINYIPIYTDTLEVGNSIMAQSDGVQNAKFINVYGRMTMNGGGGDANGGTLNLTSNSARLGIATNSITGNQPEAALDVGKNARVRGSLNVGLTNEQYLFVSTTGDTPVGYVKMGYYGTGTDYDSSGGAQAATQYTTAFSNGGKICEDERIMTFVLSRATMVSLGALGVAGKELIPQDSNFTYIVKEAYIYSVPTSGGRAPTFNASSDLQIAYQTVNNGTRTTTAYKLGTTEFNASRDSRKLMTFEQSKAVAVGTINAVPKSSVRISLSGGIADTGAGDCDFYLRMRVKNIDFNDDIKNNSQLITIS